ncbi:MAG: tetratricopeptide repeat protein [Burkholderiales bacterium]|nr:tetratricopeptide repeat protein [Burkholderiales bacterium]
MGLIENFERMIRDGKDSALLRFGLGQEYLRAGDAAAAVTHLERAVATDAGYSAAWKLLGKARESVGDGTGAARAWESGIGAAEARGDKQAAKEMQVFLRRLHKRAAADQDSAQAAPDSSGEGAHG